MSGCECVVQVATVTSIISRDDGSINYMIVY